MEKTGFDEFKLYLERSGKGGAAKTYSSVLSGFGNYLVANKKTVANFTPVDVTMYMNRYAEPASSNMFLAAIKQYLKFRVGSLSPDDKKIMQETLRFNQINLISSKKKATRIKKTALSVPELRALLHKMWRDGVDRNVMDGTLMCFYFGMRPIEQCIFMADAKIYWGRREMIVRTAKRHSERVLAWHESMDEIIRRWVSTVPKYSPEWLTKHINCYVAGGIRVTAKTGRKTLQTHMRLQGVDDGLGDMILGHASRTSQIADIYTDFTQFSGPIREAMVDKHYMIINNLITKDFRGTV